MTDSRIIAAIVDGAQKSVFPTFMCNATFGVQEFYAVEFCSSV
jgi:hypothetical protein